jgi:RNA polymerase sigma-70 factor (ECF subfamily)
LALSLDDMELVESFRAGDHEAFESLVRAHQPALFRHAMRRLNDAAAAEDAVQETFTRAYRAMGRLGGDYRLGSWLHQIMANVCIDEANRRRRESEKFDRVVVADARTTGEHPSVEVQLGLDADNSAVVAALHTLPANYQEALSLRFIEGYDYDEVARRSGVSEQNARARVSRARTAMRMALRGVAAVPVLCLAVLRRSDKAAKAFAGSSEAAATVSPMMEAAQHVAVAAPQAVPVLSKAAVGIGMLVVATSPTTAPIVVNQIRPERPAAQVVVVDPAPVLAAIPAPVEAVAAPAPSAASAPAVAAPALVAATEVSTLDANSVAVSTTAPAAVDDATTPSEAVDEPIADEAPAEVPVQTTVPAIPESERTGGVLQVGALTVTMSGPRIDVAGPVSLQVGDEQVAGSLDGRLRLAGSPDAQGRERLEGAFAVTLADGRTIDLRIAGFAAEAVEATDRPVSGLFRVASDTVALSTSGSFTGVLGATSLALTLAP